MYLIECVCVCACVCVWGGGGGWLHVPLAQLCDDHYLINYHREKVCLYLRPPSYNYYTHVFNAKRPINIRTSICGTPVEEY